MIIKRIGCLLCIALMAFSLFGCEKEQTDTPKNDDAQLENDAQSENETQAENETATDDQVQKGDDLCVKTPYVDLYFPEKWKEQITVSQTSDSSSCSVSFYGKPDGRELLKLFDIYIGADGEIPVGEITVDGVKMNVDMTFAELTYDESWSQEEIDTVCAMQEDVNYLIDSLAEEPNFVEIM